jgi:hypothetical protein
VVCFAYHLSDSYSLIRTNFCHWLDFYHDHQAVNQLAVVEAAVEAVAEVDNATFYVKVLRLT